MNPLALLPLLPKLLGLIGKATGLTKVTEAAEALSALSPAQSATALAAVQAAKLEELKVDAGVVASDNEVEKAEIASEHWFVWAARPFLLYAAGVGTVALIIAVMWQIKVDTGAVAELMLPLWGHAGFYTFQRTRERLAQ